VSEKSQGGIAFNLKEDECDKFSVRIHYTSVLVGYFSF